MNLGTLVLKGLMVGGMNTHNSPYLLQARSWSQKPRHRRSFDTTFRSPCSCSAATRGDTNYSKWLTDFNGDDLGYPIIETDSTGMVICSTT